MLLRPGRGRGWCRLPALAAGAWLLLSGCQAGPLGAPSNSPSPASAKPQLAAADAKFYSGDYSGAEQDYLALIRTGTPLAQSHYAVLLAYESRFQEAITQAQGGVDAHTDSGSLARLARALDWSQDLPGALAAGARAVASKPVDPIARVYYSEVLADTGQYPLAEAQLTAAEEVASDAYTRAEVEREWANYYRDRGDKLQEQNYIELALKDQPGFPERRLELARYLYGIHKPDAARLRLDELEKANPTSYWVLNGAADAALRGGDGGYATSLYTAALQAQPGAPEASLGLAEVDVAADRNFTAAHDRLLASLKANPGSSPLYEYLRYLDLLLLKKDPQADLQAAAPQEPAAHSAARKAAYDRLNGYRRQAGVTEVKEDPAVAEGAEAHAYYVLFNFGQSSLSGLGIHGEDSSLPGFTGANGLLRDRHFGYGGNRGAEVIDQVFTPAASVQVWQDSVFHRLALLDPEAQVAGYGQAQVGAIAVAVLDLGLGPSATSGPVVYPVDGQTGVPSAFGGNEIPDPVPPGGAYPVGYPVTLQMGSLHKLTVTSGRLLDAAGKEVPAYALLPGRELSGNEWSILAQAPLKAGATYSVEVVGQVDANDWSKRWSFTVAAP